MGDGRPRRPPSATPLGRAGTVVDAMDRGAMGSSHAQMYGPPQDEESLQEEHSYLRNHQNALKKENKSLREQVRGAERESAKKDKFLQELLAATKRAPGVPGEALDQLREDFQQVLLFKRKVYEARCQLDEKEQKIAAIQLELKAARVQEMEAGVQEAKLAAKTKKEEWVMANAGDKATDCYSASNDYQLEAAKLVQSILAAESEASMAQKKLVELQDECKEFEKAKAEHGEEISRLQSKRQEVEKQMETCAEKLQRADEIAAKHKELQERRDASRKELESLKQAHTKRLQQARYPSGPIRPPSAASELS
mmetsp:Transcript_6145/g.10656  ORF Transcript_6145/g.10656 Transcript_6145/m.10656 type:complete len:310 (+) Transcript_6145:71-1000(+)